MPDEVTTKEPVTGDDPKPVVKQDDPPKDRSPEDWSRLMQESRDHRVKAREAEDRLKALEAEYAKDKQVLEKLKGVFVVGDDGNPDPTELERRIQEERKNKAVAESAFVESMAMAELSRAGCANPKRAVALMSYQGQLRGLKANFETRSVEGLGEAIETLKGTDPDLFGEGSPRQSAPSARQVNQSVPDDAMEKAVASLDEEQRQIAKTTGAKRGWDEETSLKMYCYYAARNSDNPLPQPVIKKVT